MNPPDGGQEEARRVVNDAIAVFEETGDKSGLALAFGHRGKLLFWAGQADAALGNLERAEITRYVLAALYRGPTPVAAALQRLQQLADRGPANRRLAITALAIRAVLTAMQGSFEEARRLIAQAQALAAEGAILVIGSGAASAGGEVELLAGDFAGVERELRSTCEEFERIGELGYLSSLTPLLIDAVFRQGRLEEALRLSERWQSDRLTVPEDADAHVGWRRVRAKLLAHVGEASEADVLSQDAVTLATATDFLPVQARALADRGEVLWLAGRVDEAEEATTEAIRRHEQKGKLAEAQALRRELAARRP